MRFNTPIIALEKYINEQVKQLKVDIGFSHNKMFLSAMSEIPESCPRHSCPLPWVPKKADHREHWQRKEKEKNPLELAAHWALNSSEDYKSKLEFAVYYAKDVRQPLMVCLSKPQPGDKNHDNDADNNNS